VSSALVKSSYQGKRVIVTGAASGIGKATVEAGWKRIEANVENLVGGNYGMPTATPIGSPRRHSRSTRS
jgi:hypothetical protein